MVKQTGTVRSAQWAPTPKPRTFVTLVQKQQPRKQNKPKQRMNLGIARTVIPMETAITIKQQSRHQNHTESACEYIGNFAVGPTSTEGQTVKFMMNPESLNSTRLSRLASIYQKFRFRSMKLTIQANNPSTINGLIVGGFSENPDFEFQTNLPSSWKTVFEFDGAQSKNLWTNMVIPGPISDKAKWYNVDADSRELMSTTQGYFAIALQQAPSTTGPLSMPVLLDYTIEFKGARLGSLDLQPILVFPAGSFSYNSITGNFTFIPDAGEPAVPSLTNLVPYVLNPVWTANLTNGTISVEEDIQVLVGTTASWAFFRTLEDAEQGSALIITNTFSVGRSTVQLAHPN